jgi:hypothetical protein
MLLVSAGCSATVPSGRGALKVNITEKDVPKECLPITRETAKRVVPVIYDNGDGNVLQARYIVALDTMIDERSACWAWLSALLSELNKGK